MLDVTPDNIREWLAQVDPRDVPVICNHETGSVGHFVKFLRGDDRIYTTCVASDEPAGDLLLDGADDGTCPAFSVGLHDTGRRVAGLPLWRAEKVEIVEGGPSTDRSDLEATIDLVGGQRTTFWLVQDALDRHERMRDLRPPPSLVG